jgi:hypothetical protein
MDGIIGWLLILGFICLILAPFTGLTVVLSDELRLGQTYYHYTPATKAADKQKLDAKLNILRSLGVQTRKMNLDQDHATNYAQILKSLRKQNLRHEQNTLSALTR